MKNLIKIAIPIISISQATQAQVMRHLVDNDRLGRRDSIANWTLHFQFTSILQGHPAFHAAYAGENSLGNKPDKGALSLTATLFFGRKLWKGAAVYFNPEMAGGEGMSAALGVAGFPNGETFRIGDPAPALYIARVYFQQHIALKNSSPDFQGTDLNQLAGKIPSSRITISIGKISIADFFDNNSYSHNPRTQFLNWALMSNGAWDYPANTRGYSPGIVAELIKPRWELRVAAALVPRRANGPLMDWNFKKANAETIEFQRKWKIKQQGGVLRALAFCTFSKAPYYLEAMKAMLHGDSSFIPVVRGVEERNFYGGLKYGFGISAEQKIADGIGIFSRIGWNDGHAATWAFTEIDHSISAGISIFGQPWKRPADHIGIAGVMNGISTDHRNYLKAGGYGFMIGDGTLRYGLEEIFEAFYETQLAPTIWITLDYQFIVNPAYNKDRGPVHVLGARMHVEL